MKIDNRKREDIVGEIRALSDSQTVLAGIAGRRDSPYISVNAA